MTGLDEYLSATECAKLAHIERDTFTAYVNRGWAPEAVGKVGDRRVWDRGEIQDWLAARSARKEGKP